MMELRIFKSRLRKAASLFPPSELPESTRCLQNPGQGWYRIYTYDAAVPFGPAQSGLAEGETLALVRISLERFRDGKLSAQCLINIRNILGFFDAEGVDIILRVAYDFEGNGAAKEPDLFSQVQDHILHLVPVIREFEERILVFQGLLLGSWGEMHQSKFLSEKRLLALEEAFRSGENKKVCLALRRPVFLRLLAGDESASIGRRTLFDDAIGGSGTDMGTFGWKKRAASLWKEPWVREDELAFIEQVCARAPFGGEAVLPVDGYRMTSAETIKTLRQLHLSYLNCQHDSRVLNKWREQTLRLEGVWDGVSLYDYIGAHMGYRFCVRRISVTENGPVNGQTLTVEIENTGFGNLLQEAQAELLFVDASGGERCQHLDWDARGWRSGSRSVCTAEIPPQAGRLYLGLHRKWDGRRILFANSAPTSPTGGKDYGEYVSIY